MPWFSNPRSPFQGLSKFKLAHASEAELCNPSSFLGLIGVLSVVLSVELKMTATEIDGDG